MPYLHRYLLLGLCQNIGLIRLGLPTAHPQTPPSVLEFCSKGKGEEKGPRSHLAVARRTVKVLSPSFMPSKAAIATSTILGSCKQACGTPLLAPPPWQVRVLPPITHFHSIHP